MRQFKTVASRPDSRDYTYRQKHTGYKQLVDLRSWDSMIEDQGGLSSCSGHAITTCYEIHLKQKFPERFTELSRLFVYYNTRLLENATNEDSGVVSIKNMLVAANKYGLCSEKLWPYEEKNVNITPSEECYLDGSHRKIINYQQLNTIADILEVLSDGIPIVIGMEIFDNFMMLNETNDVLKNPPATSEYEGGHAIAIVGHRLDTQSFLVKNSFGTRWGNKGYCWITFEYVLKHCFEKWCFDIADTSNQLI